MNHRSEWTALATGRALPAHRVNRQPEHAAAVQFFTWVTLNESRIPALRLLYHIPNESGQGLQAMLRTKKLRAEGQRASVPDYCLPVARGKYHAWYMELKASGGRLTPGQLEWLAELHKQGNFACLCFGAAEAIRTLQAYLEIQ